MSLWWARREQLDEHQVDLIENLPLRQNFLVLGPPGSGKTNVLLRRAQFVRGQEMPNAIVLTFTRSLTEFVRTGCQDSEGREIFPRSCVSTVESWMRRLYEQHETDLPEDPGDLIAWKRALVQGAYGFLAQGRLPRYDALFVDEAQDLLPEEINLMREWAGTLFFVADDRQRIYEDTGGLVAVRAFVGVANERLLPFHYRLAPEICRVADRILQPCGGGSLESSCHYEGPRPGRVDVIGPMSRDDQLAQCAARLKEQIRVYAGLIQQGDRLGIIVARRDDRDNVHRYLEQDPELCGRSKIIRARGGPSDDDTDYDPTFDPDTPICILTVQGCKGLEFRAVHWLFCEELSYYHSPEHYYTVVTRAKTSIDISYTHNLPQVIARAYAPPGRPNW
jgi:superfamily I DNA/RNA helicase